jgi:transketolase
MSDKKMIAMRDAYGEALVAIADQYPKMVVLDADVSASTKSAAFGAKYPSRFFNVGVAEGNMVDVAAGLATCGLRPVTNTFAIFMTLKTMDQVRNILCYNNLPVIMVGHYAGLSDSFDGASHQAIADIALMRAMPNMTVIEPADAIEAKQALEAALKIDGPVYIRLNRNPSPVLFEKAKPFKLGKARVLREGKKVTIVVAGALTSLALEAAEKLAEKKISAEVIQVATIKPLDEKTIAESAAKTKRVIVVHEHNSIGGLYGAVAEALGRRAPAKMDFVGVDDRFTETGPYDKLLKKYGITVGDIVKKARKLLEAKK